jgi:tRNA(fMet)-specific endonuclease VapC
MKYLLDTNTCIRYLNGRVPKIREKLRRVPTVDIAVCSVVKAELYTGAAKSQTIEQSIAKQQRFLRLFQSLPFDDVAAVVYGQVRATLEKRGTPIGPNDLMIAAIALANNLILVTHNTDEFGRIDGLQLEDWEL